MNKTAHINVYDDNHRMVKGWQIQIKIDADCMFYCYPPPEFCEYLKKRSNWPKGVSKLVERKKTDCYGAPSYLTLENGLQEVAEAVSKPRIETSLVIRYTLKGTSKYAKNDSGLIAGNCADTGYEWVSSRTGPLAGIQVGARVYEKTITSYGDDHRVSYESWYGVDSAGKPFSHWETKEHPAARLNSWSQSWDTDEYDEEVAYSDEVADWFVSIFRRFAELSDELTNRLSTGGLPALMSSSTLLPPPLPTEG